MPIGDVQIASVPLLGARVHALRWDEAVGTIIRWAENNESRFVCLCNAHSLISARNEPAHLSALQLADLVAPDGAPVAWMLRRKGSRAQQRISGPELMLRCCQEVSQLGIKIFFLGSTPSTLESLKLRLRSRFNGLKIVGAVSPPYRALSDEEEAHIVAQINESGAQIVWVGLGCPKQERWMLANRGRVNAVMIGVGAAFDFHAGTLKRAPLWMQTTGLEWLHRLLQDPRRLASRYLVGNTAFVIAAACDLLSTNLPLRRSVP